MIRKISRPSTASCTLPRYRGFLVSEPNSPRCCRLADVRDLAHERVNRLLQREANPPRDRFTESNIGLEVTGGTLSAADRVVAKPYRHHLNGGGYFGAGHPHRVVNGIHRITLDYPAVRGPHRPVNDRLDDPAEGNPNNDSFPDRLAEVLAGGLEPAVVTGDRGDRGLKPLKPVRNPAVGFLFALESNRLVAVDNGSWVPVPPRASPEEGLAVWRRGFGPVQRFRTRLKDPRRPEAVHWPDGGPLACWGRDAFLRLHDPHGQLEHSQRALQPVGPVEHFQGRGQRPIRNPLSSASCGYVQWQRQCAMELISPGYRLQRDLVNDVVASVIRSIIPSLENLNSQFQPVVNA